MLELDDSVLLKEYVEHGAEEAFVTLVARHVNKVYSIALRHTRNAHQAEEITQAVFVLLARKSRQLGERVILSGWLCRTARLSAVTFVRSEIRRTRREQEAHMQNLLNESESEVWPQIAPLLDAAMAGLSEADHDAVALRFFDGKSMKEIGAALGASEDATKMRVNRAVEKLRIFFTRRGIVCSAAALTAAISANSVHAAPIGLAVTISTAAAHAGITLTTTASATATVTKAIAMTTSQKTLIASIVAFAFAAGVGTYVIQQAKTRSSSRVAATASLSVADGAADSETGLLKTPDGKPLPDADVFLSTASTAVPIYEAPPPKVAVARTGADGRFSFPLAPENRAVIVVHEKGYGQITVAELVKRHELTLQPWARVEGTLREGSKQLAGESIHLSRAIFGSQIERDTFRTHHDTKTTTDADGHYVFPRVAPGDAWISSRTYWTQARYFDIQPGQTLVGDIGGRGRPITGRVDLANIDAQVRFHGSVWPRTPHQMRLPPNRSELSKEEQTAFTAAWEKSPDAKLYNQEKCNLNFEVAADGTFIVPDVPAGDYRLWISSKAPSVPVSRADISFTVPEMPGGRSDEPLNVGVIKTYPAAPLQPGEPSPLFETATFDGKPLKLADFKGKHVLLNFWRSDDPQSLADMAALKTAQAAWGKDQRLVLIGLNLDGTPAAAQKYATDNALTWVQGYLGERSDVPMRYGLRALASTTTWSAGPKSVLIGSDGLIIRPDVRGSGLAFALEEAFGTRVKITQPGDLIFASSDNSRRSEGVANAIDNDKATKYLNHDSGRDGNQIGTFSPSGFAIQPAVGPTIVTGMGIRCANDAPDRDPDVVVLEGSNDPNLTSYESGTWTPITTISNIAEGFTVRWKSQEFLFSNATPYRNYRWIVEGTRTTPNRCCMQVSEVWLTGSAPSNQAGSPAAAGLRR